MKLINSLSAPTKNATRIHDRDQTSITNGLDRHTKVGHRLWDKEPVRRLFATNSSQIKERLKVAMQPGKNFILIALEPIQF